MKARPTGVIPPMTTPFRKDGEIDFKHVAPQVDWLIGAGSHGMAAGGSTGEGHTLDHEEYRDLVAATVEAAKGRAPVIAGIIVDFHPRCDPARQAGARHERRRVAGDAGALPVQAGRAGDGRSLPPHGR